MGVDVDGAFAEYVIRPRGGAHPAAAPVPPQVLAVLTDAVATPLHGLKRVAHLQPGETVIVLGIGGLGSNAVQLAKAMGARVIAVTRSAAKQRLARELGADVVIGAADGDPGRRRRARRPAATARTSSSSAWVDARVDEQAIAMGGPGGRVVLIGAALEPFSVRAAEIFWRELSVLGSRGFIPADIQDAIDLYLDGTLYGASTSRVPSPAARGGVGGARRPARRPRVPLGADALNLLGPALALLTAAAWGATDFIGGMNSRVAGVIVALAMLQVWGVALTLVLLPFVPEPAPTIGGVGWAALAGLIGVSGLACLFVALSRSAMGIVSPLVAVMGAAIPAVVGIVSGDPMSLALAAGFVAALVAIVLISLPDGSSGAPQPASIEHTRPVDWLFILGAGLGASGFFIAIDQAHQRGLGHRLGT